MMLTRTSPDVSNQEAASLVAILERWLFAPSAAEQRAVAELDAMPRNLVERLPPDVLDALGTKPNACHANVRQFLSRSGHGRYRQVTGFIVYPSFYLLHSVVAIDGKLFCITPWPLATPSRFQFVCDPSLEWRVDKGERVAYRAGMKVTPGLRRQPNRLMSQIRLAIQQFCAASGNHGGMVTTSELGARAAPPDYVAQRPAGYYFRPASH